MQLADLLPDIGRVLAYSPALARALGSVNAAILLCQLIYWLGKEAEPELGIYKTKTELTDETGLNRSEQDIATARLKELGLLTTNYRRQQHRLYYLLHTDAIYEFWEKHQATSPQGESQLSRKLESAFGKADSSFRESRNQLSGKLESAFGKADSSFRSLLTHEMTPEITSGEHTQEMVQGCVELAAGFAGLEGWLEHEAR